MILQGIKIVDRTLVKELCGRPVEDPGWAGVQSTKAVILTGFCHGGDNDIIDGEPNYRR
jgi:hypothetical protein